MSNEACIYPCIKYFNSYGIVVVVVVVVVICLYILISSKKLCWCNYMCTLCECGVYTKWVWFCAPWICVSEVINVFQQLRYNMC